jgi:hypothetical protein
MPQEATMNLRELKEHIQELKSLAPQRGAIAELAVKQAEHAIGELARVGFQFHLAPGKEPQ